MRVGTDPIIAHISDVSYMADIWFAVTNQKSQVKIVNDPAIDAGMLPDWFLVNYYRGCIEAIREADAEQHELLLKSM